MTSEQLKENIADCLVRLERDYLICYQGYDRPALKSLAHSLRLWVDMHTAVDQYLKENNPMVKFNSHSVLPLFNRTFRDREHMLICFPKRVMLKTRHPSSEEITNGVSAEKTISDWSIPTPAMAAGEEVQVQISFDVEKEPGQLECTLGRFIVVIDRPAHKTPTSKERSIIDEQAFDFKKTSFSSWMNSLAARVMLHSTETGALCRHDISREELIKGVANVLGGSHPQGGHNVVNDKDLIVSHLMLYRGFSLPVPYMALMKIAQDIIQAFSSL